MQTLRAFKIPRSAVRDLGKAIAIEAGNKNSASGARRAQARLHHLIATVSMSTRHATTSATPEEAAEHYGPQRITHGRRDVVTAFVKRPDNNHVLLVQRSEKILEEVGYGPDEVRLVRTGRPLYVDDTTGRLAFAVHPFLFDLLPDALNKPPRLNWENVDAQFMPASTLASLTTVPQLAETLERVNLTAEQEAAVAALVADRSHGAAQLAVWVLDALEAQVKRIQNREEVVRIRSDEEGPAVLDLLRNFSYHLATCRPSMAPLAFAAAAVLDLVHQSLHNMADPFGCTLEEVCIATLSAIRKVREQLAASGVALQSHAENILKDRTTIMTISKSSSVLAAVQTALKNGKRLKAIICESRPLCEGVAVAEAWAAAGAEVTVITDAQAGLFMPQADLVLVGADAVDADGVHNKSGTYLLALAAEAAGVPFYALADSSKISPGPLMNLAHPGAKKHEEEMGEEKSVEEVTAGWLKGASTLAGAAVRNVYFEATPLRLITALVVENGVLDPDAIEGEVSKARNMVIEAFQLQV